MKIVQRGQNRLSRRQIAIVTWTFLPKTKALLPRSFANGQFLQEPILTERQELFDPERERPFDAIKQLGYCGGRATRQNNEVNMFGHEHEADQAKVVALNGSVNPLSKQIHPAIAGQQRQPSIARKSKFMGMSRFIEMPNALPMFW